MKINVKVEYLNKEIKLTVGKKKMVLISKENKKILASDIYNIINYKKGNIYELENLKEYDDISPDYQIYLSECYELINGIIKDIS